MTPEEFEKRNPNWRDDATQMCAGVVLEMVRDGRIPMPWTNETVEMIETTATETTISVFEQYRAQMGNEIFGELVLLIGQEAKRLAQAARDGEGLRGTLQ